MKRIWLVALATLPLLLVACNKDKSPEPPLTGVNYAYEPDVLPTLQPVLEPTPTNSVQGPDTTEQPTKSPQPTKKSTSRTITIHPTVALYRQDVLDQCIITIWSVQPTVVAGHNHCGFSWLDNVPNGTLIVIVGTHVDGTYRVVAHNRQTGFNEPDYFKNYDLVLQTCTSNGIGFSLAVKV